MAAPRGSRIGPTAWLGAALALAGYAGAATAALALRAEVPLPASWWAVAGPPVVYTIVAVAAIRRLSLTRALVATAALCTAHALLLAATAAAVAIVVPDVPDGHAIAPFWSATLSSLALACVPLMLAPFRPLVEARPRYSRGAAPTAPAPPRTPAAAPGAPSVRPPVRLAAPAAPAARPAQPPGAHPAHAEPAPPAGRSVAKTPTAPAPGPPQPAAPAAPAPVAPASPKPAAPTPAAPAPRRERAPSPRAAEPVEEVIRIPFARVVDQFPAEIFRLPRERVGANLLEAEFLLVPERLVRPQLGEGLVRVGWQIVAEQFPRQALALPDDEIARRLPNASIVLPLDEVVRQVPSNLFVLSSPTVDVRAIEDFPPPFQPYVPPPTGPGGPAAAASVAEEGSEPLGPGSVDEAGDRRSDAGPEVLPGVPAAVEPTSAEPLAAGPSSEPAPEPSARADASRAIEARRIAALLGPLLSPVTVETCEREGATFLTLAPPALGGATVADVAGRVLPLLTDGRLPEPAAQATVRGTAMIAVITPLAGAPDSALVTATTSGASLALLERLSLRAAAVPVARGRRPAPPAPATAPGAEMREATPTPAVRAVAESLQAFGPVTPSVLRDPEGTLIVYLFLPRGLAARALGGFARDLHRALAGSPVGALSSVVVRVGSRRLLLRLVEGLRGGPAVLVGGGGSVERPGMARLELERAAARLGRL